MGARQVIAGAMSQRREELTGYAAPLDNDGARQVLRELERSGFKVVHELELIVTLRAIRMHCISAPERRAVSDCIEAVRTALGVKE